MRLFNRVTLLALSITGLLLPHVALQAQQSSALQVGTRVRVFLPDHKRSKGVVTRFDSDSIAFRNRGGERSMARSDVSRVQLGKRNRPLGALKFGLIGAGTGAAAGALFGAATYDDTGCSFLCGRSTSAALGGVVFGTLGLAVGIIGGAIHGEEIWTDVPRR